MPPLDLIQGLQNAFSALRQSPARVPTWTRIPRERVDEDMSDEALQPRKQYFEVRVNRIYLAREREWFTRYAPLLLAAAEFSYDGETMFAPIVIGPASLERLGGAAPVGGVVANTRLAGPYPFTGDQLGVSVVLYRMERENVAKPFLDALEGAAAALDLASGILPYAKLARVVLSGVDAATGGTRPVLARADQFAPARQGFYALVDSDAGVAPDSLSVRGGELYANGNAFRDGDYVLYTIRQIDPQMVDVSRLALFRQWQAVLREAAKSDTEEVWKSTKINFSTLVGQLYTSPDLTLDHAAALKQEWQTMMVERHQDAEQLGHLADRASPLDGVRTEALAVLDL